MVDQGCASAATLITSLAVARSAGADELAMFSIAFAAVLFSGSIYQALVAYPLTLLAAGGVASVRLAHLARLAQWHRWGAWWCVPLAGLAALWPHHRLILVAVVACAAARAGVEFRRRSAYLNETPAVAVQASAWAHLPVLLAGSLVLLSGWLAHPVALNALMALSLLAVGAAAGCLLTARPGGTETPAAARPVLVDHWRLGRWYLASLLALWATNYAFGWYLAGRGDLREAGYLHAARTLLGVPMAALLAFDSWFQPRAREAWVAGGAHALGRVVLQYAGLGTLVVAPCALAMWWWPSFLATTIFGSDFSGSGPALALTAWCAVLAVPDRLLGLLIVARQAPAGTALGFVACLGLTTWLLPSWGAEGAAGCARLLALNALAMVVVPGAWLALRWRRLG